MLPTHRRRPRHWALALAVLPLTLAACGGPPASHAPSSPATTATAPGLRLVWSDEFTGPAGSRPDPAKWVHDTGADGWGNHEWENYTDRPDNASLDGKGNLNITARRAPAPGTRCAVGPCDITSARLITRGTFAQRYGRFEARIKVPAGPGLWPAFWMLGDDQGDHPCQDPKCGEIDIMEQVGAKEADTVWGSAHGPGYSGEHGLTKDYRLPDGRPFSDDFHVFAVDWQPGRLAFSVDGHTYQTRTPADAPGKEWIFDHPFFLLLNLAVGGDWPGPPDATTAFPATMTVDYVRAYAAS